MTLGCELTCKFFLQKSFQRDRKTGLTTVKYSVEKRTNVVINGAPCSILNVKLDCDVEVTPWCDNPGSWQDATQHGNPALGSCSVIAPLFAHLQLWIQLHLCFSVSLFPNAMEFITLSPSSTNPFRMHWKIYPENSPTCTCHVNKNS